MMLWNNWVALAFGLLALTAFAIYHIMRELKSRQPDTERGHDRATAYDTAEMVMWEWVMPGAFVLSAIFGGLSLSK